MNTNRKAELLSLFVDGQPIVFEVHPEQESFHFEPLCCWKDKVKAKGFSLKKAETNWTANATIDETLFYQAIEEIEVRYTTF